MHDVRAVAGDEADLQEVVDRRALHFDLEQIFVLRRVERLDQIVTQRGLRHLEIALTERRRSRPCARPGRGRRAAIGGKRGSRDGGDKLASVMVMAMNSVSSGHRGDC